jgi:hypothetical protein
MSRLANTTYTDRSWRIHEIASDFTVEDMWSFRTPGAGPDDFPTMLGAMLAAGGFESVSRPVRLLFAARWKLGALFGWEKPSAGLDRRVASLRDRLPSDLRDAPRGADGLAPPLTPVYQLDREAVREIANKTVHSLMHLTWVQGASKDEYEMQMAILVKPNGRFGRLYLAAIAPFRHLVVYPAVTRHWESAWRDRSQSVQAVSRGQVHD